MRKIIIFGTSEFADVAYFYFKHDSPYQIVAFTANSEYVTSSTKMGLPVVAFESIEDTYPPTEYSMFIAISYTNMNRNRERIFNEAKCKDYELVNYVSSKVTKWNELELGENCFILENNVIQPFVKIGTDVIMWSGNHIGHHSEIGDHCFIASHVVISGNVRIGPYCFLGVNSTIRDGVKIAKENVIGAGVVILNDTKDKEVYSSIKPNLLPITSDQLKHM